MIDFRLAALTAAVLLAPMPAWEAKNEFASRADAARPALRDRRGGVLSRTELPAAQ